MYKIIHIGRSFLIMKNFFCAIKQKERDRVWLCVRMW